MTDKIVNDLCPDILKKETCSQISVIEHLNKELDLDIPFEIRTSSTITTV